MGQPVGQDRQADPWADGQRDQEPLEQHHEEKVRGAGGTGRLRRRKKRAKTAQILRHPGLRFVDGYRREPGGRGRGACPQGGGGHVPGAAAGHAARGEPVRAHGRGGALVPAAAAVPPRAHGDLEPARVRAGAPGDRPVEQPGVQAGGVQGRAGGPPDDRPHY